MTHMPDHDDHDPRPVQWDNLTPEVQHQIVQNAEVIISGRRIVAAFLAVCAAVGTVAATAHYGTAAYRDWFGFVAHGSKVLLAAVTTLALATGIAVAVASTAEAPGIRVYRDRPGLGLIWRQADTFPAIYSPNDKCRRTCRHEWFH